MIVKTDAIILKSMKYRDTSKIVTMYTKEFGKLQGIAKGSRGLKSKFGSSLEPLMYSQVVMYKKENRDLHLLTQGTMIQSFNSFYSSLEHLSVAFALAELVHRITSHEEKNIPFFQLLLTTLSELDASDEPLKYLYAFEAQIAQTMGFAPSLDKCARCGNPIDIDAVQSCEFHIEDGVLYCQDCTFQKHNGTLRIYEPSYTLDVQLSMQTLKMLRIFLQWNISSLKTVHVDRTVGNEIENILRCYLQHHFDDARPLHSLELLHRI
ncbi:MAG: DNA repair protein RecO [Bacteroidetes bacterium]|nr:DNA repair protein RecO [Bacteroidota bacterium]HOV99405.1 DNA repair protein RecO [Bacteroidota bacterium]